MNLLATNDFTYYLKYVFADWAVALFIFFAVLILLAVLFKGLKVGIILFIIAAVIAGGFVLAAFIIMLLTWDLLHIIDFAVKWAPTILFVTIITVSTLVNAKRGLRKSLILLAQAVGACVVCIIFFYVCVNSKDVDKFILFVVNKVLGGNTLQNLLGVSAECKTLREIFAEYIPTLFSGDLQFLFAQNPQYIVTLADAAFRIVFSVITILLYLLLVFIMYVIYFFAYPERRYKKKVNLAVSKNMSDRPYTKNHIGGGAVGLVRGITVGLLTLSFIGSAFFIVAGGVGNGTLGDYDLDNDDYNYYYSIYRSIESYGSQGIFKVLNSMTDSNDMPFYLFAADMVLSGNLDDEENDIDNKNINFREELAAYIGFAKDTMNLLLKYGRDDIVAIINGKGGDNAFDTIVDIMAIPEFRTEFDALIEEFDAQTYIINFGVSLINTIVDNIDDISFTSSISADNKELIKILFKKGYLSDVIPDERDIKQQIEAGTIKPTDYKAPPRIKVSHLLNKDDIRISLGVALSFISGEIKTSDALGMVKTLLPDISKLSILKTLRAGELDPVLARMYCYVENKYLTDSGERGVEYKNISKKNIKWLEELHTLLDVADSALILWDNIYDAKKDALNMALDMFDPENVHYEENVECFDNIRSALENSEIIGTALSTSYIYKMLKAGLSAISKNIFLPDTIEYNNKKTADGSVVAGELYYLFGGVRLLTSPENRSLLNKALDYANGKEVDVTDLLDSLSKALASTDGDGKTLSAYFTESALLRSVLSIVMIEKGADTVYVPKVSLETLKDGTIINVINKRELKQLLDNLTELVNFVKPLMEGENDDERIKEIAEFLQQEKFALLVKENRIYEGTVSNLLSIFIKSNKFVVVPQKLVDSVEGWVTVVEDGADKPGELRNLIEALKIAGVDLAKIADGDFDISEIFEKLTSLNAYSAEDFLKSEILHYTISKYIIDEPEAGGFKIIVPNGARIKTEEGDTLQYVVKTKEIISLFEAVSSLDLDKGADISSVLYRLVTNKKMFDGSKGNNTIIPASVVYALVNNSDVTRVIKIPSNYVKAGREDALADFNSSNIWKAELPRFIDALDEILGISRSEDDFVFDGEAIKDSLSKLLTGLNAQSDVKKGLTKLQLCYLSDIARSEITIRLDETLTGNDIVPQEALIDAKSHGYYKEEELESLAAALEIFGINDLLTADSEDIIKAVTDMALRLNEPLTGFDGRYDGKTALEVTYPSNIIKYIFSKEIDKALEGHIEQEVINYIKAGRSTYPQSEIAAFIDAVNEIGVDDFNSILDFKLSDIGNLDVIYASRIAAGVITKSLYESLNSGKISDKHIIDHSKAYEETVKIYKLGEVKSIYEIFGTVGDSLEIDKINLGIISEHLYDKNGVTSSYLMASAASALIKDNKGFIIPVTALDEENCILPMETALILNVFQALYPDNPDFENMENWEITEIPSGETRKNLFKSVIMRARITYEFAKESFENGRSVFVSPDKVTNVYDIDGYRRYIISEEEFNILAEALSALSKSNGEQSTVFVIPSFTLSEILQLDNSLLERLLESDILLHKLSESLYNDPYVKTYIELNNVEVENQEVVDLYRGNYSEMPVLSAALIRRIYSELN